MNTFAFKIKLTRVVGCVCRMECDERCEYCELAVLIQFKRSRTLAAAVAGGPCAVDW